jgi:glycosyltransferase involved in cell wall biosynthesis
MKILHVIDSGGLYGAEVMLLSLMQEQERCGLQPILASIGDPAPGPKPLEVEACRLGLAVQTFRMAPGPNLAGALRILKFARQQGVDLIHSHGYKGNILLGFLPGFLRRLPMLATVHGWTSTGKATRMVVYEWLDGMSLACLDRVVLVNAAMKEHPRLKSRSGLAVEVVANGIAAPVAAAAAGTLDPHIVEFCSRGFVIGAVGRLSREKGFPVLIEALAGLVREGKDVRLLILGEGALRGELEEQVRGLGLEGRVLMPGYVSAARDYLRHFGLFAMPSYTEGLPISMLEAMQASVPIVASAVGGIPGLLKHGAAGALVEPGNAELLRFALADVLENPDRARTRVQLAGKSVAEEYSSKTMAEKYLVIYRSILKSS